MSDQSQPAESGQGNAPAQPETTTETTAPPSPDFDRIYERMDQMSAQQQQMADQFGALFAEPQGEEEDEQPEYYDDEGELTEDGVREVVSDFVREQIEAELAPREQAVMIETRDDEWEALKASYPELEDRDTAMAVIADAMQWANAHNPGLIDRPEFVDVIEWVYRAQKYDETAEAQQQQPNRVVLESAAGAAQDTKNPGIDWQQRVIDAAKRSQPMI